MDHIDLLETKNRELRSRKPLCLRVCMAAGCMSSNGQAVKDSLEKEIRAAGLADQVEVRRVGCLRLCCEGPLVASDPKGELYQKVTPDDTHAVVAALKNGDHGTQTRRSESPVLQLPQFPSSFRTAASWTPNASSPTSPPMATKPSTMP